MSNTVTKIHVKRGIGGVMNDSLNLTTIVGIDGTKGDADSFGAKTAAKMKLTLDGVGKCHSKS